MAFKLLTLAAIALAFGRAITNRTADFSKRGSFEVEGRTINYSFTGTFEATKPMDANELPHDPMLWILETIASVDEAGYCDAKFAVADGEQFYVVDANLSVV